MIEIPLTKGKVALPGAERAELRALVAVARAAERVQHSEMCGVWALAPCDCLSDRVTKARERLDRVSREGR